MKKIRVRIAETARDGVQFKWTDFSGVDRQQSYEGRRTRNRIDEAKTALEDELNRRGLRLKWPDFVEKYRVLWLGTLEPKSQGKPNTMIRRFEETLLARGISPDVFEVADITTELVLSVREQMQGSIQRATLRSNMNALWSIINWGIDEGLLPEVRRPRERTRKSDRTEKTRAKGRSLTMEEIERMISAVKANPDVPGNRRKNETTVRKAGESAERVVRAIHAMRLIGLRLEDCHLFRFEPADGYHYPVNLDGRHPMIAIAPEQKSGEEELIPLTPPAVKWLRSLDETEGYVCRLQGKRGHHRTANRLGRIIASAGRAAGIIVKRTGGRGGSPKYASAHDLRRTFCTTWLDKLPVNKVQTLSRHADPQTLLRYYSDVPAERLAAELNSQSGGYLVDDEYASDPPSVK